MLILGGYYQLEGNLVNLVIVFVIKNPYSSICTHTVRPIPRTTDIRMRMTSKFVSDNSGGVVFVTPVRHVKDMMQTMKRIMDKEWKRRIDDTGGTQLFYLR